MTKTKKEEPAERRAYVVAGPSSADVFARCDDCGRIFRWVTTSLGTSYSDLLRCRAAERVACGCKKPADARPARVAFVD